MTEHTVLTPIELTDAELDAVSGGVNFVGVAQVNANETKQSIHQRITEVGGSVRIGGGSGATANSGNITLNESFSATQSASNSNSTSQSNTNSGAVTGAI
jgi:hypothetical protein